MIHHATAWRRAALWLSAAGIVLLTVAASQALAAEKAPPPSGLGEPSGMPIGIAKIVLLVVLFIVTALLGNWAAGDVPIHQKLVDVWGAVFAGGAVVALVLVLAVPVFAVGFLLALAAMAAPFVVYVRWRNALVPPQAKAFTPEHIKRMLARILRSQGEGEIAAERAVHVASASGMHLTAGSALLYMKTNDMPIRLKPESEEQVKTIAQAERMLSTAIIRRAGQLYILPQGPSMQLRLREAGALREAGKVDKAVGEGIIAFFKQLAELDVEERRKPQTGRFIVLLGDLRTNITVQTSGSVKGEHMIVKLHAQDLLKMHLEESGMRPDQAARLRTALKASGGGVILMSAPKHNGRTVSMYAALRELDLFARNVVAVEDEISIEVPDVHQVEVDKKAGATLATTVQGVLRGDPDVVMVETIGDAETAQMLLTGAAVGKVMIGGLVAGDAAEAIESFLKLAGNRQNVAATLLAATNQRLMRTLCPACREAYRPNPEFLRKANLQASQVNVLYREPKTRPTTRKGEPILCPSCSNEGYVGRTALYEVVVLDDKARAELAAGRSVAEIRTMLRKQEQQFLQEEGLYKVVEGVTSVSELLRVLNPGK